ncbi:hypothetical protein [Methyloprofundus sp.]|uniref:hypothetical protein n=1 Tax=Methyloprofundus sp. TaxID=2020875 RepID=UPI003D0F8FA9
MNLKKLTAASFLLTGIAMSPFALAQQSFDGHNINLKFEIWNSGDITSVKGVTNEVMIFASDATDPDEQNFYVFTEGVSTFDWDIDFNQNMIKLTYTSIEAQDFDNQYMYEYSTGFHFEDTDDSLPDIVNVQVDTHFAPFGLDPELIMFDKNNIYVNLDGSMCHIAGMGSMPNCANPDSPTGYDNEIKLIVEFAAGDAGEAVDTETIDKLYDWAEAKYPEFFPTHQDSMDVMGYYARFYSVSNVYMGAQNGHLYVYGPQFGGLIDAGALSHWVEQMEMDDTDGCAEGQHMMPDGMCMNNTAM